MQVLCMYLAKSTKRSSLDDVLNRNVSAHVQAAFKPNEVKHCKTIANSHWRERRVKVGGTTD